MRMYWIMVLIVAQKAETVYWTARTPIQFYENVLLECKIQTHDMGRTKWTRGHMNEILTYNEGTIHKDKFSAEFDLEKNVYYLNITNFNEQDVNVVYTCFNGLDKYSRNLTMDENQFELIPNNDTVTKMLKFTNGVLNLNVTFVKVWPSPNCSLTVNNKESTGVMRNHTRKEDTFLQSFFTYSQAIDESEVFVAMSCTISTKRFTVFAEHLINSNVTTEYESSTFIEISPNANYHIPMLTLLIIIVAVVTLILVRRLVIRKHVKKKNVDVNRNYTLLRYVNYD